MPGRGCSDNSPPRRTRISRRAIPTGSMAGCAIPNVLGAPRLPRKISSAGLRRRRWEWIGSIAVFLFLLGAAVFLSENGRDETRT
jgi:hypothetical protein